MSVALITGSTGLVGSESVNFFCDKGFDVVGIDNNMRKFFFGPDGSTNWIKHKLLKRNKKESDRLLGWQIPRNRSNYLTFRPSPLGRAQGSSRSRPRPSPPACR